MHLECVILEWEILNDMFATTNLYFLLLIFFGIIILF